MSLSRRNLIKGIGAALVMGAVPSFYPSLLAEEKESGTTWSITGAHGLAVGDEVVILDASGEALSKHHITSMGDGSLTTSGNAGVKEGDVISFLKKKATGKTENIGKKTSKRGGRKSKKRSKSSTSKRRRRS
jgi:hypothetical protein